MQDDQHIHVHIHNTDERLDQVMAKIDDLKAAFERLSGNVQTLLDNQNTNVTDLQNELDALKANDDVENELLEGLQTAVDKMNSDIEGFEEPPPVDEVPPADGSGETPEEPPVTGGDETPGTPPSGEPGEPPAEGFPAEGPGSPRPPEQPV